jgi:hypothetical protein
LSSAQQAAVAAVHDMLDAERVEAPADEAEVSSPEGSAVADEAHEAEQDALSEFVLDPEVPEDILALVEEPDFEEEAEAEIAAQVEEWDEEEQGYVDPAVLEERKARIKLEKKLAHVEAQRVKESRKAWASEAEKFYPLADATKIDATSRRGFLREAKRLHDANKPYVLKGIEKTKAELHAEFERKFQEAKAELEAAWGVPVDGTVQVPASAPEKVKKIDQEFKRGIKHGIVEMLRQGE